MLEYNFVSTIHPTDCDFVESLNIKKFNAVIAGGAALRWYQSLPVDNHDIDIFFKSEQDYISMIKHLRENLNLHNSYSSSNAESFENYKTSKTYKVQLIKQNYADTPYNIIKNFDISVSQIATDGSSWFLGPDFSQDFKDKKLRFVNYKENAVKRLVKYWVYGFQPDSNTLSELINRSDVIWDFQGKEDADYGTL